MSDEPIDDTPAAPYIRRSQKYPGLVSLSWEDSERLVRQAESGKNGCRVVYAGGPREPLKERLTKSVGTFSESLLGGTTQTALERRVQSIGVYKLPRKPGWIHGVQSRQTRHGADWGIILGLAILFGGAVLLLAFLGAM